MISEVSLTSLNRFSVWLPRTPKKLTRLPAHKEHSSSTFLMCLLFSYLIVFSERGRATLHHGSCPWLDLQFSEKASNVLLSLKLALNSSRQPSSRTGCSSLSLVAKSVQHGWILNFIESFSISSKIIKFLSSLDLLMCWLISFPELNHPHVSGINPTGSDSIVL